MFSFKDANNFEKLGPTFVKSVTCANINMHHIRLK